ncbi:1,4-dihydroxy-6-naphthoate synthase [Desulfosporosinus youngiae]|uniref:1,4-dihydroxy-6-naphtoate synthase n=1 Tax=Desulfosporosinus youngiae DSM 17734 TaxID=768710 RepID=H5XSE7_9FIRM|nr:1,4-dihydroxy-6-naphthoate synthase [Desulfosporosinus youngiae]EHQ87899.1 putative periplasmic solute-binding protein [Desulfosporosinus youngiae DSM 17734]
MNIAFSPCPNDTFVFHAWVHGLVPGAPKLEVTYADIDITNSLAAGSNGPDVVKISYAALPWVLSEYALLPCGGALGKGCGPLLLTSNRAGSFIDPAKLHHSRVAVPSERSTAYLLFRLWAAQHVPGGVGEIIVLPFHEIMPAVRDGLVDAGLVIHEARFTYPSYGLILMADLGSWWEQTTNLPIPLGAIIARRSLDLPAITGWIQASVRYAWAYPERSREYVLHHSQELSAEVTQAHIKLYVNEFTETIGELGYKAVETLLSKASLEGLVPKVDPEKLRF